MEKINLVGSLVAISMLGETGSSIVILKEDDDNYYGLKLFPGGNGNIILKKEETSRSLKSGELEVIDQRIPLEFLEGFEHAFHSNELVED